MIIYLKSLLGDEFGFIIGSLTTVCLGQAISEYQKFWRFFHLKVTLVIDLQSSLCEQIDEIFLK